jgi:hypothetical protein
MENDFGFIISATNEVNDNIWLGDLKEARNSAMACVEKLQKRTDLSEIERTTSIMKEILKKVRKEAKEQEVENVRLWVAERVSEEVKRAELSSTKIILGILWDRLQNLANAIIFLSETETQMRLDDARDQNTLEKQILRRRDGYRYSIIDLPDRWEVRAVVDTPAETWGLDMLRHQLLKTFHVEEILRKASSDLVELYSSDMYVHIMRLGKLVRIIIHSPKTDDIVKKIDNVVATIINSLIV